MSELRIGNNDNYLLVGDKNQNFWTIYNIMTIVIIINILV